MAAPALDGASLSAAASGSGTTITVDAPTGVVEGDLVLIWVAFQSDEGITPVTSVSTILDLATFGFQDGAIYGRIATGAEPSTYTFTISSAPWVARSAVVDGADVSNFPTSLIVDSSAATANATSVVVPELTGLQADCLLLAHMVSRTNGAISNSDGMTPLWDTVVYSSRSARSWSEEPASGDTGTRTFTGGDTQHSAGIVALAPAAGGNEAITGDAPGTSTDTAETTVNIAGTTTLAGTSLDTGAITVQGAVEALSGTSPGTSEDTNFTPLLGLSVAGDSPGTSEDTSASLRLGVGIAGDSPGTSADNGSITELGTAPITGTSPGTSLDTGVTLQSIQEAMAGSSPGTSADSGNITGTGITPPAGSSQSRTRLGLMIGIGM